MLRSSIVLLQVLCLVAAFVFAEEAGETPAAGEGETAVVVQKEPVALSKAELDKLLSDLEARQEGVEGFKAEFVNEKESGLVFDVVESTGRLVFVEPGHMFREVRGEEPVTTILHNDELLLYFPKERKAERYFLKKEVSDEKEEKDAGSEDIEGMLAGLSFDRKKLEKRFELTATRQPDGLVRVDLVPLKEDDPMLKYLVRISLWTDEKSPWPVEVETENPDGDISRDKFSKMENIKTEDVEKVLKEVFDFKLPRGVRVMTPQR